MEAGKRLQVPVLPHDFEAAFSNLFEISSVRFSFFTHSCFMLISGRAPRSFIHPCASTGGLRPFNTVIIIIRKGKNRVNYTNSAICPKSNDSEESLLFYTVPVTISVLIPGFVIQMPVTGSWTYSAAGTVTFPAIVANIPVVSS